ncbi:MAG: AMP-binding protein [Myxococcota bacterium]
MTVIHARLEHAEADPERLAFDIAGRALTRAALVDGARRVAAGLAASGVRPGDRVALALGTSPELVWSFFGAELARAVPVALDTHLSAQAVARRIALVESARVVDAAEASRLLAHAPLAPAALPAPSDLAFLQVTSGTSGEPRAVMISHANVLASVLGSRESLALRPGDVFASWMPIHHDLGLVDFMLLPAHAGLPCWLLPPSLAQIRPWLQLMSRVGATITGAPDFAYRLAARIADDAGAAQPIDLARLRIAISGGEPLRAATIAAFEARWSIPGRVRPGYGLAEATLGVTFVRAGEPLRVDASGSVSAGRAAPGAEVRVRDGQIEVRGAKVCAGYFGDAAASAALFTDDGWLRTGDSGALDDDSYLFVHGRQRAMIKRAGAVVAPREVEEAAERAPGVRLSAAVGIAREEGGTEDVVVVVEVAPEVAADTAAADAITRAVADEVLRALGFAPGRIVVAPPRTIPRTANGKIRHAALRQTLGG